MKEIFAQAGDRVGNNIHFVSTHAQGDILFPSLLGIDQQGTQHSITLMYTNCIEAMAFCSKQLAENPEGYKALIVVKDGYMRCDEGRTDALLVDIHIYDVDGKTITCTLAAPYRPAWHPQGFAIHRIKLIEAQNLPDEHIKEWMDAFSDAVQANRFAADIMKNNYISAPQFTTEHGAASDAFSTDEWLKVQKAPYIVFVMVAGADGKIDKKEADQFIQFLMNCEKDKSDLFHRSVTQTIQCTSEIMNQVLGASTVDLMYELRAIREIVNAKAPADQIQPFKDTLLVLGQVIAEASGGFMGLGDKVSKEEKSALSLIKTCLMA